MPKPRNIARDQAIGARICLARVLRELNRPALGTRLGVTHRQVAKYEHGEVRVLASMLEDLGELLDCDPTFFLVTDLEAVARAELLELPSAGSIARRHLDQALAVLNGGVRSGARHPFAPAATEKQHGSEAA